MTKIITRQIAAIVAESRIEFEFPAKIAATVFSVAQCSTPFCNLSRNFILWHLQICVRAKRYNIIQTFAVKHCKTRTGLV